MSLYATKYCKYTMIPLTSPILTTLCTYWSLCHTWPFTSNLIGSRGNWQLPIFPGVIHAQAKLVAFIYYVNRAFTMYQHANKVRAAVNFAAITLVMDLLLKLNGRTKQLWAQSWLQRWDNRSILPNLIWELCSHNWETYHFHRMEKKRMFWTVIS